MMEARGAYWCDYCKKNVTMRRTRDERLLCDRYCRRIGNSYLERYNGLKENDRISTKDFESLNDIKTQIR